MFKQFDMNDRTPGLLFTEKFGSPPHVVQDELGTTAIVHASQMGCWME
jgi:hypothetical protein